MATGGTTIEFADAGDELASDPSSMGPPPDRSDVAVPADDALPSGDQQQPAAATPSGEGGRGSETTTAMVTENDFDPDLLRRAGISASQAMREFESPEGLERAVRFHDMQLYEAGRSDRQSRQQQQQPNQQFPNQQQQQPWTPPWNQQPPQQQGPPQYQQQQNQQPPPQQQQQQQQQPNPFKLDLKLDETWDAETVKVLNQLNDHYSNQMLQMQQQMGQPVDQVRGALNQMLQHQINQAEAAYVEQFDAEIGKLGKDWEGVFGKGGGRSMDRNSEAFKNRVKLDEFLTSYSDGRRSRGMTSLPLNELVQAGVRTIFHQQQSAMTNKQVSGRLGSRRTKFIQRANGTQTSALTGEERAIARAQSIYRERGIAAGGGSESDDV